MKINKYMILATGLAVLSCGKLRQDKGGEESGDGPIVDTKLPFSAALNLMASCSDVEEYLRQEAYRQMVVQLMQQRDQDFSNDVPVMDTAAEESSAPGAGGDGKSTPSHSTTNVQVAGVDEPDIVKTNGNYIYAVGGKELHIMQSFPTVEAKKVASLALPGSGLGLFLLEGEAVIITAVHSQYPSKGGVPPMSDGGIVTEPAMPYPDGGYVSGYEISRVDLQDPANPKITSTVSRQGEFVAARMMDGHAHFIGQRQLVYPEGFKTYLEVAHTGNDAKYKHDLAAKFNEVVAKNAELLQNWHLNKWLGEDGDLTERCLGSYKPSSSSELGLTEITSLDLVAGTTAGVSLFAPANDIYANNTGIYIVRRYWDYLAEDGVMQKTLLHKFKIDEGRVSYQNSGSVDGEPVNQFSLDEWEGVLRVATTAGRVKEQGWETYSIVSTFDGDLNLLGQSPELAPGERLYAVRFVGTMGFLVTFRQIDPLFTLDLSDAKAPKVLGELKVPGYSTYIHMLGENHLLTIGVGGDWGGGVKLSIFDVTDKTKPVEDHNLVLNESYSEAQYDHKAFTFDREKGLLALPLISYGAYRSNSSLILVRAAVGEPLAVRGEVSMAELMAEVPSDQNSWWDQNYQIRRGIFIEDTIWAVSGVGAIAASSTSPDQVQAKVAFKVWRPQEGSP